MSQQFHHIPALLKAEEMTAIEKLISESSFRDGKDTATMTAREVKNNFQLDTSSSGYIQIQSIISGAIQSSPYFQIASQPKTVHPFLISKYTVGKYYGWHVDSPIMGIPAIRTDMAMTIFLSDPATYEGGELVIQTTAGPVAMKPSKGDAVLYPCQFLHYVNEVKSGERVAAITWIQSNIQSSEQRQLLFELNQVHALLNQKEKHAPETNLLLQVYSNLFRMWADV
ncbi:MAG: Fe2+-dependent dioxygenase [Chitinophagaceae bacterium]|nr:Fe2+-dependent dioxygenase [Chitinophagaceae bacterium]